jgi:hypothetical protein
MSREKRRQRISLVALGVTGFGVLIWGVITPLKSEVDRLQSSIGESRSRTEEITRALRQATREEQKAAAEAPLDAWADEAQANLPNPFLVQGHERLTKILSNHHLADSKVDARVVVPLRGLPNLAITTWTLEIPRCEPLELGGTLADLENEFPLGQLAELTLKSNDASGTIDASVSFQTVVVP